MDGVDARYLGLTANQLAKIATDLKAEVLLLRRENAELIDEIERLLIKRQLIEDVNTKLRELAAGIGHLLFTIDADYCVACPRDDINHPCPVYTVKGGECLYKTDLRELGVEVDE